MAKKRKKLSREERKRRRREAIERKRRERGWKPRQAPLVRSQEHQLVEDMLPFFPTITATSASPGPAMEILMVLIGSGYMANEPEFEEMIIDPMLCLETFADVVQELDIELESLDELPDEDFEDIQMDILVEVTRRLLTDELCQDILNGLNDLRLRLKRSNKREEAARAAALQLFLSGDETQEIWSLIGLVQAIFARSIYVGLELMEASREIMEVEIPDEDGLSLLERIARSRVVQKADKLFKKIPGLGGFLEKQADRIWEEGLEALFMGELYLELFSEEELTVGFDILQTVFKDEIAERMATQDLTPLKMTEEHAKAVILQLDDYFTKLMTPKRLEQLQGRLNVAMRDPAYKEWLPFLYMLIQSITEEDTAYKKHFLVTSFLGEMNVVIQALQEHDLDEED